MMMVKKLTISCMVALLAISGFALGGGTAAAQWRETPRIGVMGEDVWTVGSGGACQGAMHVSIRNDVRKPGWVQLVVRSKGFTRDKCRATLKFVYHNTVAPFNHERFIRVEGTKKRGALLARKSYWIGSGLDLVAVTSNDTPASKGISYYIAIP